MVIASLGPSFFDMLWSGKEGGQQGQVRKLGPLEAEGISWRIYHASASALISRLFDKL
jgi:hypothetical protein